VTHSVQLNRSRQLDVRSGCQERARRRIERPGREQISVLVILAKDADRPALREINCEAKPSSGLMACPFVTSSASRTNLPEDIAGRARPWRECRWKPFSASIISKLRTARIEDDPSCGNH